MYEISILFLFQSVTGSIPVLGPVKEIATVVDLDHVPETARTAPTESVHDQGHETASAEIGTVIAIETGNAKIEIGIAKIEIKNNFDVFKVTQFRPDK